MNSRDLVINTLNHEAVDRVPRDWRPSGEVQSSRADEVAEINDRFPRDIIPADFKHPPGKRGKGGPGRPGRYTDAWGCTWQVSQPGAIGQLVDSPLADAGRIAGYRPPLELFDETKHRRARLDALSRQCAESSRFVLAEVPAGPFDRFCFLRGAAAAAADLRSGAEAGQNLLAMLHDFFCREMETWSETDVDAVLIRDDLGASDGSPVDSTLWRSTFKPLYRQYCKILHAKDKFVFFRSAGNIGGIFGELIRTDIDAIHLQPSLLNVERLAKRYRGRVTFCTGIDDSGLLSSGSLEQIRQAVLRLRQALDFGCGGVIAQCSWRADVRIQSIVAMFEQWMARLPMHV